MIGQDFRYNWADLDPVPMVRGGPTSGNPVQDCWRSWPHNPHTHRGRRGDQPLSTCRGVNRKRQDFFLAR